jgi:hypothetical protein
MKRLLLLVLFACAPLLAHAVVWDHGRWLCAKCALNQLDYQTRAVEFIWANRTAILIGIKATSFTQYSTISVCDGNICQKLIFHDIGGWSLYTAQTPDTGRGYMNASWQRDTTIVNDRVYGVQIRSILYPSTATFGTYPPGPHYDTDWLRVRVTIGGHTVTDRIVPWSDPAVPAPAVPGETDDNTGASFNWDGANNTDSFDDGVPWNPDAKGCELCVLQ